MSAKQHLIQIEVTQEDVDRARAARFADLPEACRCPIRYALERIPYHSGVWTVSSHWALAESGNRGVMFDEETVWRIWRWDRYGEMEPFTLRGEEMKGHVKFKNAAPALFTPQMMHAFCENGRASGLRRGR